MVELGKDNVWLRKKNKSGVGKNLKRLSITPSKRIGVSIDIVEKLKSQYIQVYWKKGLIGIKAVSYDDPDRYKLGYMNSRDKGGYMKYVAAKFPGLKSGWYHLLWSEGDGMFVAEVEEEDEK